MDSSTGIAMLPLAFETQKVAQAKGARRFLSGPVPPTNIQKRIASLSECHRQHALLSAIEYRHQSLSLFH